MNWLDLSFSAASETWCRRRLAEGWLGLVQDVWTGAGVPGPATANLQNARAAGMRIACYTVVSATSGGVFAVDKAKAVCGDTWPAIAFVAVDVELAGTPLKAVMDGVARVKALGKRPIVYSRRSFWVPNYGDIDAGAPVWTAEYDGEPMIATVDYPWGKQKIVGKQYQNTTTLDGVQVDLNVFDPAWLKEDDMAFTTEDKRYLGGLMRQTIKALTEGGAFLSALQGDPDYAQPAYSLKAIVAAIQKQAVVAGVTENEIVAAVKKALKEGAG